MSAIELPSRRRPSLPWFLKLGSMAQEWQRSKGSSSSSAARRLSRPRKSPVMLAVLRRRRISDVRFVAAVGGRRVRHFYTWKKLAQFDVL